MWKKRTKPLQVGITGGIGSGKSLICKIFAVLGVPVYEADSRAKAIYVQNLQLKKQIIEEFGQESYLPDGQLNRKHLAAQVFTNGDKVALLNSLVHPRVAKDFTAWLSAHTYYPYVIKEAALLFESGSYKSLDKIITVFTPLDLRIQRIAARDTHRTPQEIQAIIGKQLSEEDKMQKADYVLLNDEKHLIIPQVLALHRQFIEGFSEK